MGVRQNRTRKTMSLGWLRRVMVVITAIAVVFASTYSNQAKAAGLIRDAEIESLLRIYTYPIFRAAGLNPGSVRVHLISADSINAFVTGGQRIFIHTGLLLRSKTPNVVIGVLAHETGHIAGGHLFRLHRQLAKAQTTAIIAMLLGAAALVGGAAAGKSPGQAGAGLIVGGQSLARRQLLSYQRAQEATADQAAIKYLSATGQSARGMIILFEELANQAIASLRHVDPYVMSHPMPRDRIGFLQNLAKKSPYYNKKDSRALLFRHKLMQAKLRGFLERAPLVMRRYPQSDKSSPARYARAVVHFRQGNLEKALREIDVLAKRMPKNPYIWELKGQALFESGKVRRAIVPLKIAVKHAPNSGLIRILLARALLATGRKQHVTQAITHLIRAKRTEGRSVSLHRQLSNAYGKKRKIGRAMLSAAEAAFYAGDLKLAKRFANRARSRLKRGTPQYQRAKDILRFKLRKKK